VIELLAESTTTADDGGAMLLFLVVVGGFFYFLPTIIGLIRRVRNLGSLIVVNIFLGWTLIGWVVALAMSMRTVDRVR